MSKGQSLPHPLAISAMSRGHHLAWSWSDDQCTYAQLMTRVQSVASCLLEHGYGPGDRIALMPWSGSGWAVALHGIGWIGASAVCVPPVPSAMAAARLLEHADVRAVIGDSISPPPSGGWDQLMAAELVGDGDAPERFWPQDEERFVVFTSGTTGAARPVSITKLSRSC